MEKSAGQKVAIYLINGIRLVGIIEAFDSFTVILSDNGLQQLIYKHVISTIVPGATQRSVHHSERDAAGSHGRREEQKQAGSSHRILLSPIGRR